MLNIQYICTSPKTKLSNIVNELIEPPQRVFLSMYRYRDCASIDEQLAYDMLQLGPGPIVDHPDLNSKTPVVPGKCQFIINDPEIHKTPMYTLPMENPTWKDLLQEINHLLRKCDTPIGFLEAIVPVDAGTFELKFAH